MRHRKLFDEMMRYFGEVGARIPKKNPDFDDKAKKAYRASKDYQKKIAPYEPFKGRRVLNEDERPRQ